MHLIGVAQRLSMMKEYDFLYRRNSTLKFIRCSKLPQKVL